MARAAVVEEVDLVDAADDPLGRAPQKRQRGDRAQGVSTRLHARRLHRVHHKEGVRCLPRPGRTARRPLLKGRGPRTRSGCAALAIARVGQEAYIMSGMPPPPMPAPAVAFSGASATT